ncbi:MAG: hypothetical protein ACYCO3_07705 [Mycobacteriales bacterium]
MMLGTSSACRVRIAAAVATAMFGLSACGGASTASTTASGTSKGGPLIGLLRLTPGACQAGSVTGSYFRMIQPNGSLTSGPFVNNADSKCSNKTYTLLAPGTAGGLRLGGFQPPPAPAFSSGNGLADSIAQPDTFFAVAFAVFTANVDRQTGKSVPPFTVSVNSSGQVSGVSTAWQAAYNNAYYNQGAPKPGGAMTGLTRALSGTYNASTHRMLLHWSSQIVGGAFANFTGVWTLQGTFVPNG